MVLELFIFAVLVSIVTVKRKDVDILVEGVELLGII